jgi:hypothetical protein
LFYLKFAPFFPPKCEKTKFEIDSWKEC